MSPAPPLAGTTDTGALGVFHLKRLWSATRAAGAGVTPARDDEGALDRLVTDALGLGLHQALQYLFASAPGFDDFEAWVVATAGRPDPLRVQRLNACLAGAPPPAAVQAWLAAVEAAEPVLGEDNLAAWERDGYVVLRQAVSGDACAAAEAAIWQHLGAAPDAPESWYGRAEHGIMVELVQHAALAANRRAPRIHKAFSQLWRSADLWVSADRCGFHPPQREGQPFPGPDLHWDMDLSRPDAPGTQGILYLTNTPPEQGALTLVPGFQHRLAQWLAGLPPGADPQNQDLHALGSVPVAGAAGDMVIWHHALPHGSRPNLGSRPRIVQYINLYPAPTTLEGG